MTQFQKIAAWLVGVFLFVACLTGCGSSKNGGPGTGNSSSSNTLNPDSHRFAEVRAKFKTKLIRQVRDETPVLAVPDQIKYGGAVVYLDKKMHNAAAYIFHGKGYLGHNSKLIDYKRPAIIWITGGLPNCIGDVWTTAPANNDQTASAFRKKGITTLYPSLRGGNGNRGSVEFFCGEIDDVLAAADYVAQIKDVDPSRIYLGGHSTGGTLAMLVAAASNRFRAVFAFGPVDNVSGYGGEFFASDPNDPEEVKMRSPIFWLDSVKSPLFVLEGRNGGNIECLRAMQKVNKNDKIKFIEVNGADHFSILQPFTTEIANKIIKDMPTEFAPDDGCYIQFDTE